MSRLKERSDGTTFNPAVDAAYGHHVLRLFLEEMAVQHKAVTEARYRQLSAALNSIGDRLQTCSAIEMRNDLKRAAHERARALAVPARGRR